MVFSLSLCVVIAATTFIRVVVQRVTIFPLSFLVYESGRGYV